MPALPIRDMAAQSAASATELATQADQSDRVEHGMAVLRQIGGRDFDGPIRRLAEISPDMARLTVEYPYGDILSRPGLDLRLRQICTVGALIAQGSVQPQLKFHMDGLLNVGGRPRDLVEIMFLSTVVLGFPAAIDAIGIVRQIFAERAVPFTPAPPLDDDGTDRYRRGLSAFRDLMGANPSDYVAHFGEVAPELGQWSIEFAFGDVLAREGLEAKARQLAIVSMLATIGNRVDALRLHLRGALSCGATPTEIMEALIQISVYAGFPAALNAFTAARDILESPPEPYDVAAVAPLEAPLSESRVLRRERGLAALTMTSSASGAAVVRSFDDIAPDIGRMIVEHSYGDIFHRSGIDPKTRELTACAALAARGTRTTETPLRVHINAALTAGASRAEVVETLLNVIPYGGYPAAQQAMQIAGEEFSKRGV
jgi:4-carboxymuconolactone decarboxylase